MKESKITVNGQVLSECEAMTVRVALDLLLIDLEDEPYGKFMTVAYRRGVKSISAKMRDKGGQNGS